MSTAVVLLFLLALGAIPGAMVPQRNLNAQRVADYLTAHPVIGPVMDELELFDAFTSFWFAAIHVLPFTSLIGCLTPHLVDPARHLRARPVPAPRNLPRLPHYHRSHLDAPPEQVIAPGAHAVRRWRVSARLQSVGVVAVSAEKGCHEKPGIYCSTSRSSSCSPRSRSANCSATRAA